MRRQIGVVFGQKTQLWWDVPLIESYRLLREIYRIDNITYQKNLERYIPMLGLEEVINKPVLLKRGLANTIEEWIMAAEYIMSEGNPNVIFCERGIRTFEKFTRNTLDLSVIPIIKERTHLPIVIDPSHATGDWKLVEAVSLAAIAAGADGLIIEVHCDPQNALSDGAQSLKPENYASLVEKGRKIAEVIGRSL